ncbi:MAG TPA: 30S ribosomal protein S6, partial [Rhizomicrobium sp.]
ELFLADSGAFPYIAALQAAAVAGRPDFRVARMAARVRRAEAVPGVRPTSLRCPRQGPDMALYEHLLIARQDISAQAVDALATHLKTIVEGEGGKVEKQEYWGLRGLAYRIKKNRKGHYVLLNINAPANAVVELERQLKINEDVLRYLTVKVDQFDVSSNKNRRDDRAEKPEGAEAAVTEETVQ